MLRVRFSDLRPVSVSQDHDYPTSFSLTPTKRAGYSRIAGNAHTPRAKATYASDLVGQVLSSPYPGTGSSNLALVLLQISKRLLNYGALCFLRE